MSSSLPSTLTSAEIQAHADYFSVVQADLVGFLDTAGRLTREMERQRDELIAAVNNDDRVARTLGFLDETIGQRAAWVHSLGEYAGFLHRLNSDGCGFAARLRTLEAEHRELCGERELAKQKYEDSALVDGVWALDAAERYLNSDVRGLYDSYESVSAQVRQTELAIRFVTTDWFGKIYFWLTADRVAEPVWLSPTDVATDGTRIETIDVSRRDGRLRPPWRTDSNGFPTIDVADVNQGGSGDCYFVSVIASIVLARGGVAFIQRMIRDNGDGTFTVFFPGYPPVTVDGRVPAVNGAPARGWSADDDDYWFVILEKAFARISGTWEAVTGGNGFAVMTALGLDVSYWASGGDSGALERMLRMASDCSAAVTASVSLGDLFTNYGEAHEMSVLRLEDGPPKSVVLRNPWRVNDLAVRDEYDGLVTVDEDNRLITVSLDVFERHFDVKAGVLP